jgi:hypothetical protein
LDLVHLQDFVKFKNAFTVFDSDLTETSDNLVLRYANSCIKNGTRFLNFMICSPQQMYYGDSIKEDGMGGACGTYGGGERYTQGCGRKT